jgi:hypothetical protein
MVFGQGSALASKLVIRLPMLFGEGSALARTRVRASAPLRPPRPPRDPREEPRGLNFARNPEIEGRPMQYRCFGFPRTANITQSQQAARPFGVAPIEWNALFRMLSCAAQFSVIKSTKSQMCSPSHAKWSFVLPREILARPIGTIWSDPCRAKRTSLLNLAQSHGFAKVC